MARDGNGTYNKTFTAVTGTVISSTDVNTQIDDIATALTGSIAKNGETVPSANLPMGSFRHTNVGAATARTDYCRTDQVQDGLPQYGGTAGGTATALTCNLSPAISAYTAGLFVRIITASNSGAGATLSVNGLTAKTILSPLTIVAGDWKTGDTLLLLFDGTNFRWVNKWRHADIPAGTNAIFVQASAPTGWTQYTGQNDRMLRIVSGSGGGIGGAWAISGLSTQTANHHHPVSGTTSTSGTVGQFTGGTGSLLAGDHTHTFSVTSGIEDAPHSHAGDGSWRPAYTDVIIAIRDT